MKINKVFKNASWIIGCKIAQSGFALIINALTARYFGPSNFGLINYAASLVAFVTPIMTLGTSEILVSEIIRTPEREGEILGTSILMTFISSVCCVVGLSTFVWLSNHEDSTTVITVTLYSLLLISQSLEQIQYWFHAKYLSKYVSLASFFAYLIISAYKVWLLAKKKNIYWFAVSNSLDYFLIAIALMVIYYIKRGPKLTYSYNAAKKIWRLGKHYIIPGLMGLVLAQSDRVMLRWICGDSEVGFYSAALSISGLTGFVFSAIITSLRPMVLESKKKSEAHFSSNMAKFYGIIIYLAIAQSVMLTLFAEPVVKLLYGQSFQKTIPLLRIVVWYTAFSYVGGVRTVWILAENKQRFLWIISSSGMILNVVLNLMLIPKWQGVGASIATLITQFFTNIILVYCVKALRINIQYISEGLHIKTIIGK